MTPQERAAAIHLRKVCDVAYEAGEGLTEHVSALNVLRDGINQRAERETKIRKVLRGVVMGQFSEADGLAEIEAILDGGAE